MALNAEEIETLMDVLTRDDPHEKRRQKRQEVCLNGHAPAHGMEPVSVSQISSRGARFTTVVLLELQQQVRVLIDNPVQSMTLVLKVIRQEERKGEENTYGAEIIELIR